jgi:hypothetical protein
LRHSYVVVVVVVVVVMAITIIIIVLMLTTMLVCEVFNPCWVAALYTYIKVSLPFLSSVERIAT